MKTWVTGLVACLFAGAAQAETATQNAHDFSFTDITDAPMALADYKGKAILVVNTASKCGFTPQYEGLQTLHETYAEKGLVIIGVPSNEFGGQEPGSNEEIKSFCETNYNIRFPLAEKTIVTGDDAHPFYQWVRSELGWAAAPKWNFYKYLIAPDGTLTDWFSSKTTPESDKLIQAIEAILPQ